MSVGTVKEPLSWQWRYLQSVKTLTLHITGVSVVTCASNDSHVYVLVLEDNKVITKPLAECSKGFGFVNCPIAISAPLVDGVNICIDDFDVPTCAISDLGLSLTWGGVNISYNNNTLLPKPTTVKCKQCASQLSTATIFKESPSEHWAELVDCWSCHKQEFAGVGKDLIDNSVIIPRDHKTVIYNTNGYILLVDPQSCTAIGTHVSCRSCGYKVGVMVSESAFFAPILRTTSQSCVQSFVSMRMIDLINAHSAFTFTVNDELHLRLVNWTCAVSACGGNTLYPVLIVQCTKTAAGGGEHVELFEDDYAEFCRELRSQRMLFGDEVYFIKRFA